MSFESFPNQENQKPTHEVDYATKYYSASEPTGNDIEALHNDFPGVKQDAGFKDSLPFLQIQLEQGKKYIVQYDPQFEGTIHNPIHLQSSDLQPINLGTLAEKMGISTEALIETIKKDLTKN